jgi:phosphoribosylglycinamide formyltransferase 1
MSITRKRVVIMISGRGSNMAALISAASEPAFPAEIVGVVSDQAEAAGLALARSNKIPTRILPRQDFRGKVEHDQAIHAALVSFGADIVCLAGYMRLLTPDFVGNWEGRLINIHPALLPLFRGLNTHGRALDAGMRIHGCTVHFVTPMVDDGPIIAQATVPVLIGDDEDSLAARVLKAEHHLYPLALRMVAEGKVRMENGRAAFDDIDQIEQNEGALLASPSAVRQAMDLEHLARITP